MRYASLKSLANMSPCKRKSAVLLVSFRNSDCFLPQQRTTRHQIERSLIARAAYIRPAVYTHCTDFSGYLLTGVNETPRSTSRLFAEVKTVKLSFCGNCVALTRSVMTTIMLGSAPWSPFPLTVEVTA